MIRGSRASADASKTSGRTKPPAFEPVISYLSPTEASGVRKALVDFKDCVRVRRGDLEMPAVISGLSWTSYEKLLQALEDRRFRHSYDRGRLEVLVSPRKDHDHVKTLLARLLEFLAFELDIPIQSMGSTTLGRKRKRRGLEPDECYYIENEPLVRSRTQYDPEVDPPPDLAIEVDVTSTSISRLPIYADIGVPEIWRWDGKKLVFLARTRTGKYRSVRHSLSFPMLRPADLMRFVELRTTVDEHTIVRRFLAWVRSHRDN